MSPSVLRLVPALAAGWSFNTAVVVTSAGLLLIYLEFNRPGRVLPGATGLLFVLLGLHSLSLLHLRPVAVLLVVVAFALLALPLRHASVWLCSLTGTALLVLGLARLSAPETWSATAAAYGLVLGPLTGWLANVAGRARRAKRDLRPSLSQRRPAPLSSSWE